MLLRIMLFFMYVIKDILIWMKRLVVGEKSKNDADRKASKTAKTSDEKVIRSFKTNELDADNGNIGNENLPNLSDIQKNEQKRQLEPIFGKTLADFGYAFNDKGELRNVLTGAKFIYEVEPGNKAYNQAHYDALGKVIDEVVYELLEKECELKRVTIPDDAADNEPKGFYFESNNAIDDENLMIIIHGSGVVRAGQWARRLIINDRLETGTQIPYIKKALELGMGVVVLNTNQNELVDNGGRERTIRNSDTPLSHTCYVWDKILRLYKAKNIAIVAHSAGGWHTVQLFSLKDVEQLKRVFAVCFTDSVHIMPRVSHEKVSMDHLREVARNWICSSDPLDIPIFRSSGDIQCFSAGTGVHELSSHCAIESIFKYVREKLDERLSKKSGQSEKSTVSDRDETAMSVIRNGHDQVSNNPAPNEMINGNPSEISELKMDIFTKITEEAHFNGKIENAQREDVSENESLPSDDPKIGPVDEHNEIDPDGVIIGDENY
uniref:Arb2 domain-containing protein n=1 Tax=Romanomermis culicivorax TaxID=13658 RepID=A0A915KW93_ROMCU